jgi:hypothetical protein
VYAHKNRYISTLAREIVRVERRTIYQWYVEENSGEPYTVEMCAGSLICSCGMKNCTHMQTVERMICGN